MMARRYEAYKAHVVRPFFRDHFARLDRQIVLVDALSALNSGRPRSAISRRADRRHARVPRRTRVAPRLDLPPPHRPHPVRRDQGRPSASCEPRPAGGDLAGLTARAIARAEGVGAEIDVIALAAIRATREAQIRHGPETLDAIIGVPEKGETIGGQVFDGVAEAAVFPGELPADPNAIFEGDAIALPEADNDWRFVRFRPPLTARVGRAADSARPRAAIRDRGPSRMRERPPRPRAFRLDDARIAVDDKPAPLAPEAVIRSQHEPIPAGGAWRRSRSGA